MQLLITALWSSLVIYVVYCADPLHNRLPALAVAFTLPFLFGTLAAPGIKPVLAFAGGHVLGMGACLLAALHAPASRRMPGVGALIAVALSLALPLLTRCATADSLTACFLWFPFFRLFCQLCARCVQKARTGSECVSRDAFFERKGALLQQFRAGSRAPFRRVAWYRCAGETLWGVFFAALALAGYFSPLVQYEIHFLLFLMVFSLLAFSVCRILCQMALHWKAPAKTEKDIVRVVIDEDGIFRRRQINATARIAEDAFKWGELYCVGFVERPSGCWLLLRYWQRDTLHTARWLWPQGADADAAATYVRCALRLLPENRWYDRDIEWYFSPRYQETVGIKTDVSDAVTRAFLIARDPETVPPFAIPPLPPYQPDAQTRARLHAQREEWTKEKGAEL